MSALNILHISDVHIQKKDAIEIQEIVKKLIADVKHIQKEKEISIDLICFTGDLIQRGDKAEKDENQWQLSEDILINPLLSELNLSQEDFVFIPGNHEVDTSEILHVVEKGLKIKNQQDIKEIMDKFDQSYNKRLSYFYSIVKKRLPDAKFGDLGYSYKKSINGIQVGIACVDSAWRSTGKGAAEKGTLYVSTKQIQRLYQEVSGSDLTICMMHHPVDWLEDCESLDVEKELSKFDLVLRGHVHDEDLKQIARQTFKTIYSTAGKLFPLDFVEGKAIDGYNGYSILSIDLASSQCHVWVRTYYGKNRKEFDQGINILPNGEQSFDLCSDDKEQKLKHDIMSGISQYFCKMSERYALIKEIDAKSPKDMKQILVDPVLAERSEYLKENGDEEEKEITIQHILDTNDNLYLIGKKETGKTTILQQIGLKYSDNYGIREIIPIYINMKYLQKGDDRLLSSTISFIQNNILENQSISKKQIETLISADKTVFLIDNVNPNNVKHTRWLTKFIRSYSNNRFILTIEEEFFQSLDIKQFPDYGALFKAIYIHYMGKAQIRAIVKKWAKDREEDVNIEETVNKINSYCNQINFAKTPFNIAILMVIWDNNNGYVPPNESIIMRNYLDIVLEKLAPDESLRSTYSFNIKQHFLSYITYQMYSKDEYSFTQEEFDDLVKEYHRQKGYKLSQSKFDTIFFEKNILSRDNGNVFFSHTSFLEYFLALYALEHSDFLEEIIKKGKRSNFRNEICFYSGLSQDCSHLLDVFSDDIISTILERMDLIDSLNNIQIITEFKMNREQFIADIKKNRPTQEQIDIIHDQVFKSEEVSPTELKKSEMSANDDFLFLLLIYGSVIKNAELLDNKYKIEHLENYMFGMNMLYGLMLNSFQLLKEDIKFDDLSDQDKAYLHIKTEEEFEKGKEEALDFSKMILPIAIQNLIFENVGTPKLEAAINTLIQQKEEKPFEKFMLIFLKCDLNIVNLRTLLGKYIKNEKSKDILKIALMKLTFYYRSRFFGIDVQMDKDLLELITEINLRLSPQKYPGQIKPYLAKGIKGDLGRQK